MTQSKLNSLIQSTAKKSEAEIRTALKSDEPATRFAAAIVVGDKSLPLGEELTSLLTDPDILVRQAARQSLIVLSYHVDAAKKTNLKNVKPKAVDFGPRPTANKYAVRDSAQKWKDWVAKHSNELKSLSATGEPSSSSTAKK